jgi:hypothetical protein
MANRGDILKATKRGKNAGKHFIIFYENHDTRNFIGAMITHSEDSHNIPMDKTYFHEKDAAGNNYKVVYDNTFLVNAKLMKFESWGPFQKVGELTSEGVEFVESIIDGLSAETWEEFLIRTKN